MSKLLSWVERHADWIIVFCIVALILFVLSGCGFSRGSLPEHPDQPADQGLGAQLASVGGYFTWVGLIVAGLALVVAFVTVPPVRGIIILIGEAAGGLALVGGFFVWLADNLWMVVLACILTGLAYGWYRWPLIRRWLDRIKARAVKP